MGDRWLAVDEIVKYFGVNKDIVYTWGFSKETSGHHIGRFWKFKKDEIDDWVWTGRAVTVISSSEVHVE